METALSTALTIQRPTALARRRTRRPAGAVAAAQQLPAPPPRPALAPRALSARSACRGSALLGTSRRNATDGRRPAPAGRRGVQVYAASVAESDPISEADRKAFNVRRTMTFIGMVMGYATYYFTRLSFTYTAPVMKEALNLDMIKIGAITTIFPIAYAFSKFLGGIMGDILSPRQILAAGLIITGTINIAFGLGSTMIWFSFFWLLNGAFQGIGAPACAKLLTNWFSAKQRGTWWGIWNVSHNTGGTLIPFIAGGAATALGWRYGMICPGAIAICIGFLVLYLVRDSPESIGLPTAEEMSGNRSDSAPPPPAAPTKESTTAAAAAATPSKSKAKSAAKAEAEAEPEALEAEKEDKPKAVEEKKEEKKEQSSLALVLSRPSMWLLGLSYFFVYACRQGMANWTVFYLLEEKGVANAAMAAARMSGMELGGLFGNLSSGFLADKWLRSNPEANSAGIRVKVMICYFVGMITSLFLFWNAPASSGLLQWLALFCFGHFLYGPQMLMALTGAETVPKTAVATSNGFLGWIAYIGAASSGLPMSIAVKQFGWNYFFVALMVCSVVGAALLLPLVNLPSHVQTEQRAKAKAA